MAAGALAVLFLPPIVFAQSKADRIDSLIQAARARGQWNGALLVSERGRIIYKKAVGEADFEKRTPLRTDSAFELASLSKPITALAVMKLKESGKLSYEDRLTDYFPTLPYPGVTIRHMLTHMGGLPALEPYFGPSWPAGKVVTNADVVERLAQRKTPPFFAPGERWKYDNTAYLLLARIVEIASGMSYEQFLQANVFKPLGMKNSSVYRTASTARMANLARGYIHTSMWSDDYATPETLPRYNYIAYFGDTVGPRGVYSTVEDLYKWVEALNAGRLIRKETLAEAYTPAILKDGSTPSAGGGAGNGVPSHYGFGWFIEEGSDGRTVRHTGDWPGYITCLIHNLDKDQTIIALSNASDPAAVGVANAVENILNGRPYTLPKMSVGRVVGKILFANGPEAAVDQYRRLKKERPDDYDFSGDGELNTLGYELMRRGDKQAAVDIFKLNVESFPNSWNAYDSLAEAFLAVGDKKLAIANYRRSVELNPENRNGVEALKRLEAN
jgi:CubicO group peptidase (beta-lactamase class C family)